MPPVPRQIPLFAAEPFDEPRPYGRWARRSASTFGGPPRPIRRDRLVPDRTLGGRTYVPASAPIDGGEAFGYVSYTREHEGVQAAEFEAVADHTDETAAGNPDWTLDLSDHEIGHWRGPQGRRGVITLVWEWRWS